MTKHEDTTKDDDCSPLERASQEGAKVFLWVCGSGARRPTFELTGAPARATPVE